MMALEDEGYDCRGASRRPSRGCAATRKSPADTVLVDLMLPGMDGFDCIRKSVDERRPVVVVSARDDTHDIVAALEVGADDYLVKPVATKELTARLRALRRRTTTGTRREALVFDDLEIRPAEGEVLVDGRRWR